MASIAAGEIDKIAIIGAGPAGLAAAKYLLAEKTFTEIVLFEQRLNVGGVWNATPHLTEDVNFTIPQTRPSTQPNKPSWECGNERRSNNSKFDFLSPVYNNLETNIPYRLMNYSDQPFPADCALFPHHEVVLHYLERYADDIRHLIRFGTQVLDGHPILQSGKREKWSVTSWDLKTTPTKEITAVFDAVIVATGHYDTPFVPDIDGIEEWSRMYPGSISHSKFYRKPDDFKGKKVLIVGNSASGTDIANQLLPITAQPLLISSKSASQFPSTEAPTTLTPIYLPPIAQFIPKNNTIRFTNDHTERHIDHIIFCTGYLYSFPFLRHLPAPLTNPTGPRVHNLHNHLLYTPLPTLSFLTLPQRIVPFPLAESQSAFIARLLSGRLPLPSIPSPSLPPVFTSTFEPETTNPNPLLLFYPLDATYINQLHALSLKASLKPTLDSGGEGKIPPYWGEEEQWVRERIQQIKAKAREWGERRGEIRSLGELGFDFGAWKAEKEGGVGSRL